MTKEKELENKILELEKKISKQENKNKNWISNFLGWIIFLGLLILAWNQINPLIKNLNGLTGQASSTLKNINKSASQSNEILDKVNHPIKNIEKFNPF